jgi:dTDP-4-amino-4,6-dideoxygalactose transaminase
MIDSGFSPWPSFTEEEAEAVKRVVLSNKVNYWTGQETREFEKEFAAWVGTKYAVAVTNGTVALDLALIALGIGEGDEVIVTSRTFLASASCIVNVKAVPVFADVDKDSQNITAQTIEAVISPKTKAIICVHLAGWPCDMDSIKALAQQYDLYLIEDCAQAHGALYKGQSVGTFGHVSSWSFCQDKIITTGGEGGMVTTNDYNLWKKMWSYKDHGKSWEAVYEQKHPFGFRWLHHNFGTNWRMMEVQAVLGRIQLKQMTNWQKKRLENATKIWETASKLPLYRVPTIPEHIRHAAYKCYVFINPEKLAKGWDQSRIVQVINEYQVPCYFGSCSEVYLEKAFEQTPYKPQRRLTNAKELGETSLMFLVHPTLTEQEIRKTCDAIMRVGEMMGSS